MKSRDDAIVRPIKSPRSPVLDPTAVLVATRLDLKAIRQRLGLAREQARSLFISRLWQTPRATIVGPMVGAPYAVMILETLFAWGARRFLFLGWCGSLTAAVGIGDILLPDSAAVDEGTSGHYRSNAEALATAPSGSMTAEIRKLAAARQTALHTGRLWSTDAVFRETPSKVRRFLAMGAQAVDMETSALFTVSEFHGVELAALLVVSDTLADMRWQHGFRSEEFVRGRTAALDIAEEFVLRTKRTAS